MKQKTQFQSENMLMSVLGHLVILAIMVFSFSVVVERAKLVTPNRIQIIEIDLKNVRVSGNETRLYNTGEIRSENEQKDTKKDQNKDNAKIEKITIKQPTMVETESKDSTKEKQRKESEKNDKNDAVAHKKKVVRVNREVLSLDRTMTVSVIDALRVALTRCWNIDTTRSGLEDIRLTAHIKFLPTGVVDRLWFESESRAQSDSDFAYVLDTAREAIKTCSPFSMLPRGEYDTWRDTTVTFYPTSGKVM